MRGRPDSWRPPGSGSSCRPSRSGSVCGPGIDSGWPRPVLCMAALTRARLLDHAGLTRPMWALVHTGYVEQLLADASAARAASSGRGAVAVVSGTGAGGGGSGWAEAFERALPPAARGSGLGVELAEYLEVRAEAEARYHSSLAVVAGLDAPGTPWASSSRVDNTGGVGGGGGGGGGGDDSGVDGGGRDSGGDDGGGGSNGSSVALVVKAEVEVVEREAVKDRRWRLGPSAQSPQRREVFCQQPRRPVQLAPLPLPPPPPAWGSPEWARERYAATA